MNASRTRHHDPTRRSRGLRGLMGVLGLVASLVPAPASAQARPDAPLFATGQRGAVLSGGFGEGSRGGTSQLAIGIPAGPGEVVLRIGGAGEGVLYGVRIIGGQGWIRLGGGGVGLIGNSPSLAGQLDLVLRVTERVGLGLGLEGALGGGGYTGFTLGLYLGWPGYVSS